MQRGWFGFEKGFLAFCKKGFFLVWTENGANSEIDTLSDSALEIKSLELVLTLVQLDGGTASHIYGRCLYQDPSASRDDVAEAVAILEDVQRRARRVFGPEHPNWESLPHELAVAREMLATFDT